MIEHSLYFPRENVFLAPQFQAAMHLAGDGPDTQFMFVKGNLLWQPANGRGRWNCERQKNGKTRANGCTTQNPMR